MVQAKRSRCQIRKVHKSSGEDEDLDLLPLAMNLNYYCDVFRGRGQSIDMQLGWGFPKRANRKQRTFRKRERLLG